MRTTKKEFKVLVQNHILMEVAYNDETDTHGEDLQNVVDGFLNWYSPYEQKQIPNKHNAFMDYCMGLPSNFNIKFTDYDISLQLKEWFNKCSEEYKPSKNEAKLYLHLVAREFTNLCKAYNVKF